MVFSVYRVTEVHIVWLVGPTRPEINMHKSNYSLEVLVNGRPAQEYYKDSKSFVEARAGTEYTLRFRNNSWKRVMAIFSVDGVDVLKGKKAADAENGYIIDPFSSTEIKGYRIDDKTVAAFKFSHGPQSYAVIVGAKTDEPDGDPALGVFKHDKTDRNNGVIGVRVFEEDTTDFDYKKQYNGGSQSWGSSFGNIAISGGVTTRQFYSTCGVYGGPIGTGLNLSSPAWITGSCVLLPVSGCISARGFVQTGCSVSILQSSSLPLRDYDQHEVLPFYSLSCTGSAAPAMSFTAAVAPTFDLGSTWGNKVEDKIREVSFKRVATATDIVIYYATRQSLETWGIDFSNVKQIFAWPSAFEDKKQYCKVPPGYKV